MNSVENGKPVYLFDKELVCGIIEYNGKKYFFDFDDMNKIINFEKKFVFINKNDLYPCYNYNEQKINYLMFLYNFKENNVKYVFKNNNPLDLRRSNIEIYHIYHEEIIKNYDVKEYIQGHFSKNGNEPYYMKNPIWKIDANGKEVLLMYCEKNTIIKLCQKSLDKLREYEDLNNDGKKLTFHKHSNGYILSSNNSLFIHQIIMNCYGNGKGTKNVSVDHIDQDPLNNTLENLRIATRKEQEENTKGIKKDTKRERNYNAKPLPQGITKDMLRKYIVYYHEWLNPERTRSREFFRIEKHPKLEKIYTGTKSNKISIQDKLKQIIQVLDDLDNDIQPEKEVQQAVLPMYVSLTTIRGKPHFVFEKRINDKRLTIKMVLPEDYDLQEQLEILNNKIKEKYKEENISIL
jgi:hypothetical protein